MSEVADESTEPSSDPLADLVGVGSPLVPPPDLPSALAHWGPLKPAAVRRLSRAVSHGTIETEGLAGGRSRAPLLDLVSDLPKALASRPVVPASGRDVFERLCRIAYLDLETIGAGRHISQRLLLGVPQLWWQVLVNAQPDGGTALDGLRVRASAIEGTLAGWANSEVHITVELAEMVDRMPTVVRESDLDQVALTHVMHTTPQGATTDLWVSNGHSVEFGRFEHCEVQFSEPYVSRSHATLVGRADGSFRLTDTSHHGTLVRGPHSSYWKGEIDETSKLVLRGATTFLSPGASFEIAGHVFSTPQPLPQGADVANLASGCPEPVMPLPVPGAGFTATDLADEIASLGDRLSIVARARSRASDAWEQIRRPEPGEGPLGDRLESPDDTGEVERVAAVSEDVAIDSKDDD